MYGVIVPIQCCQHAELETAAYSPPLPYTSKLNTFHDMFQTTSMYLLQQPQRSEDIRLLIHSLRFNRTSLCQLFSFPAVSCRTFSVPSLAKFPSPILYFFKLLKLLTPHSQFYCLQSVRKLYLLFKKWRESPVYKITIKPGLHLNANTNDACGSEARQNIWYICTLFGICRGIE